MSDEDTSGTESDRKESADLKLPSSDEIIERFVHWLGGIRGHTDIVCPVCAFSDWTVQDLAELREFIGGRVPFGGRIIPVVPVSCGRCGYIMLFNAIKMGLLPLSGEPEDSE